MAQLGREQLQDHPDRATLALMAAAAYQQLGRPQEAKALFRQALDWKCSPRLIGQILISGTHNSLARAHANLGHQHNAAKHFSEAIEIVTPGADRLIKNARSDFQTSLCHPALRKYTAVANNSKPKDDHTAKSINHDSNADKIPKKSSVRMQPYDHDFYANQMPGSERSARCILGHIFNDIYKPKSIIDIGCGAGTWL
jgi:tetratricopeptide (TPR) repeat protein